MIKSFKKHRITIILWFMIFLYIGYFSIFAIRRIGILYAHYFDLGIMHQTVYNTYQAIRTFDFGRFLELANPHGLGFVKRMAIHNDLLLALLAPLYFIYSGPQTLVVVQTIVLALGAWAIFGISREVLKTMKYRGIIGLVFAFSYLMYVPMQRANMFDFHAVTFATSFILFMFYFWLKKRYWLSFVFFTLTLLTKEQIGLTTFLMGLTMLAPYKKELSKLRKKKEVIYPAIVMILSLVWFAVSMLIIIPYFRRGNHFALGYYTIFKDPFSILYYIFHIDTLRYFVFLLGPLAFLSLLSPLYLIVSGLEFAINLFSNSWNMRNIIYHYTSVIQPFVFISAIYGMNNLKTQISNIKSTSQNSNLNIILKNDRFQSITFCLLLVFLTLLFSYFKSPLLYSREGDVYLINKSTKKADVVKEWSKKLEDESIPVSSTGHLAPLFTSRRYYYYFPNSYENAEYVVVQPSELYNYFDPSVDMVGMYKSLRQDKKFTLHYQSPDFEVYKKIK